MYTCPSYMALTYTSPNHILCIFNASALRLTLKAKRKARHVYMMYMWTGPFL